MTETTGDRYSRRMTAASAIARQMQATKRLDPRLAAEADAWVWSIYNEEDKTGRIIACGRSVCHRKDLSDEWHRLRFTKKGEP